MAVDPFIRNATTLSFFRDKWEPLAFSRLQRQNDTNNAIFDDFAINNSRSLLFERNNDSYFH